MKRLLIALVLCVALVGVVAADTAIFYTTNLTDGRIYSWSSNATFYTLRNANGAGTVLSTNNGAEIDATTLDNNYSMLSRAALVFNTSGLPDDCVISSAVISQYLPAGSSSLGLGDTGIGITKFGNTSGIIIAKDFQNKSDDRFSTDKSISAIPTNVYSNWTLNLLGIENISKTTNTGFYVRLGFDIDNTSPTWSSGKYTAAGFRSAESVTTGPFITITYTVPPPSLTNLTNSSPLCNSLLFNYTVPSGVGNILIYRNNTQLANQTNTSIGVLWEDLPENTDITFSSRTCSIDGLVCNSTWVNMTARTSACGVAPIANFTANATSICVGSAIQFNDTSENIPTSWNWSFGDGNYSAQQNPIFQFNATGSFSINLTATNAYGSDFENKTNYVSVTSCEQPTPTPTPTPTLCYYVNVTGATLAENYTNLSFNAGTSSWGVTVWNQSEGNLSWWQCGSLNVSTGDPGAGGGEAAGAALGLIGGLLGALVVLRRDEK